MGAVIPAVWTWRLVDSGDGDGSKVLTIKIGQSMDMTGRDVATGALRLLESDSGRGFTAWLARGRREGEFVVGTDRAAAIRFNGTSSGIREAASRFLQYLQDQTTGTVQILEP